MIFNNTIIPLAFVGYEMIIANSAPRWLSITSYPTRARGIMVKYVHVPKYYDIIVVRACAVGSGSEHEVLIFGCEPPCLF